MRNLEALIAYLASRSRMPFEWGSDANDCVSFMAGAVRAQTGFDPIAGLRWKDERQAVRVIRRLGGLEAAVDWRMRRIPPALALRGDVAGVADERFGLSLLIVEGVTLVGPGSAGAKRLRRAMMIAAWSAEPAEDATNG